MNDFVPGFLVGLVLGAFVVLGATSTWLPIKTVNDIKYVEMDGKLYRLVEAELK